MQVPLMHREIVALRIRPYGIIIARYVTAPDSIGLRATPLGF